jgi:hypothetical protein
VGAGDFLPRRRRSIGWLGNRLYRITTCPVLSSRLPLSSFGSGRYSLRPSGGRTSSTLIASPLVVLLLIQVLKVDAENRDGLGFWGEKADLSRSCVRRCGVVVTKERRDFALLYLNLCVIWHAFQRFAQVCDHVPGLKLPLPVEFLGKRSVQPSPIGLLRSQYVHLLRPLMLLPIPVHAERNTKLGRRRRALRQPAR